MGIRHQNSVAAVGLGEGLKWIPKLRLKQVLGMDHQFLFVTWAPFLTINLASFTFRTTTLEKISISINHLGSRDIRMRIIFVGRIL